MPLTLTITANNLSEDGSIAYIKDATPWGTGDYPVRASVALLYWADRYQPDSFAKLPVVYNPLSAADAQAWLSGDMLVRYKAVAYPLLSGVSPAAGLTEVGKYYYDAQNSQVVKITGATEENVGTGIWVYTTEVVENTDTIYNNGLGSLLFYKEYVGHSRAARATHLLEWANESDIERRDWQLEIANNISALLDAICVSMQLNQYKAVAENFRFLEIILSKFRK